MELNSRIKESLNIIAEYASEQTDWLIIKRLLINSIPVELRATLSKRHPKTKKHTLNAVDENIIKYWKEITGVELILDPEKIHHE